MRAFQDMLLGPLKAMLMRVLQQQLSKYIHNIELEELGLMGGDVVLENLELRKDVLHDIGGISTDYDFSRGFIKELRIHIPWTRLQSRPIEIKIKTVEIIITPITHTVSQRAGSTRQHSRHGSRTADEQTAPAGVSGWMQQLLTKVLANISIEVSNLVLKYEDADVVLSAALKSLVCFSADSDRAWAPAFAILDDPFGFLHKHVRASDLTVCLDRYCAPGNARRRQVQAFEVPILNRASFEVRLLACVWLLAPGPPESSMTTWDDQQLQHGEWLDGAETELAGVSPSPGMPGPRRGLQSSAEDGPRPLSAPKISRQVTLLGRLVGSGGGGGGGRRGGTAGGEEPMTDAARPEMAPAAPVEAEGGEELYDELPVPSVCRMLMDGWSRRTSSSYSPFFDGEGAWSRSETASSSAQEGGGYGTRELGGRKEGVFSSASTTRGEGDRGAQQGDEWVGAAPGGESGTMPVPLVAADVLIADLSFSLSNLQVRMISELIERAVRHVARNATQKVYVDPPAREPPAPPDVGEGAPAVSSWWPSFWRGTVVPEDAREGLRERFEEKDNSKVDDGERGRGGSAPYEPREFNTKFVVASAAVGSVSLRLLEHQEQAAGRGGPEAKEGRESPAAEVEEPESISVPVHGLGTVSIISTPIRARKQALRSPIAFIVAEVKGLVLDAHVLSGDDELSADVKLLVTSVVVRQTCLGEAATAPPPSNKFFEQTLPAGRSDLLEPIVSWGVPGTAGGGGLAAEGQGVGCENPEDASEADPRTATKVQQSLIEIARGSSHLGLTVGEAGSNSELRGGEDAPSRVRAQEDASVPPTPTMRLEKLAPCSTLSLPAFKDHALQYRLLKHKGGDAPLEGFSHGGSLCAESTVTCHDIAVGPLRVQLAEILLEKLLMFCGVVSKQGEGNAPARATHDDEKCNAAAPPRAPTPVSFVQVQGQPLLADRLSLRSSKAKTGTALSSPKALPPRPPTSSLEVSLHVSLRSVDVAIEFGEADVGGQEAGCAPPRGSASQRMLCVFSLGQLEITCSESSLVGREMQQRGGQHYAAGSPRRREENISQRVCSMVLGNLSIVFVDGSVLAAEDSAQLAVSGSPTLSQPLARQLFLAAGDTTGVRRLLSLAGARVTAEILSKPVGGRGSGGGAWTDGAAHRAPDFLFNASLDAVDVCASVGATLSILEACVLAKRVSGRYPRVDPLSTLPPADAARWAHDWRRGIRASLKGVSVGGVVKSGGCQVTGNMRRLVADRVAGNGGLERLAGEESPAITSKVAVFEGLPREEGDGEGLSWAVEASDDGCAGIAGVKLRTVFKCVTLHYVNANKAFTEIKSMLNEWTAGAPRLTAGSSSAAARRSPSFEFDVHGSVVVLHLPFDLKLEVEGVHVCTSPGARVGDMADGDLDINLTAGDVRVYHQSYGADCCCSDVVGHAAIRCAARGVVTTRPGENAAAVSLASELVHVRLTPAFCASFGLFVRLMVGPPPRPPAANSVLAAADARARTPPKKFTFELGMDTVGVDFLAGPCNPAAVSAAFVVGGVTLRQNATGAVSAEAGSQASFEMSFQAVEATQRRDPYRNAPALPQAAVRLIGDFLRGVRNGSGDDVAPGIGLFSAWLCARKAGERGSAAIPSSYVQPFIVPLGTSPAAANRAFYVKSTSSGPRHRLVNSLALRLTPVLLVCYPPTFRILVGHYNRFAANAFRSFRSAADIPRRRLAVVSYDIDIRGCGAVLLASLVDGARGLHVSAGEVTFKENAAARASPAGTGASCALSSPAAEASTAADTALAMSGFVGPVGIAFLQDWRLAMPAPDAAGKSGLGEGEAGAGGYVQLCAPIDLRWAVLYDELDMCRQDVSLSSVQFYLEQPHFDLCVRVAQIFVAADFPGALPPAASLQSTLHSEPATAPTHAALGNTAPVDSFLATSLRLPLVQVVLANGKRNGPFPPVLEFDVASVRLARGGVFTVKHLSVKSWCQVDGGDSGGCGYRILGRSGQSGESGKNFLRTEVQVREGRFARPGASGGPTQPQLDVVFQVQPFNVHVNPSILRSLTGFIAPVPFEEGSPEDQEVPFPLRQLQLVARCSPSSNHSPSATRGEGIGGDGDGVADGKIGVKPRSSVGERVSTNFERSAMTASASVRLLASQVTLEVSSYPGGPAFTASTSHVFLRAITWPSADEARVGGGGSAQAGPEVFARLSRVSCRVRCPDGAFASAGAGAAAPASSAFQRDGRIGSSSSHSNLSGDTVLKPFDVDVHLTRPGASETPSNLNAPPQGWHAGVYLDEVYVRFGPSHKRSLELLADLFLPAVAAAELTAVELAHGQRTHRLVPAGPPGPTEARVDDLRALDRVDCRELARDAADVKPEPGQAVFFGVVGAPRQGPRQSGGEGEGEGEGASAGVSGTSEKRGGEEEKGKKEEEEIDDEGWVHCCEWRYWGPRRVAQIALPHGPIWGGIPLLEGIVLDALEVELTFVDPLTDAYEVATRFNVQCCAPNGLSNESFADRSRLTLEPSQPILARSWRISWRVPTWLRLGAAPTPQAISAWSAVLLRALAVRSSPSGPVIGSSYVSATLVAHRLTLALLTEGPPSSSSPSSPEPSGAGEELGLLLQPEEIVRVVVGDVNAFVEAASAARLISLAARGSAVMAVDVQDFSNFLRLPLVSHALVKFDVSTSTGGGGANGGGNGITSTDHEKGLLSPFRPVLSGAVAMHDAVISLSVTAMQCVDQCIAELAWRPLSGRVAATAQRATPGGNATGKTAAPSPSPPALAPPHPVPPPPSCSRQPRQRSKRYVVSNHTDRDLWFGQVSTTETLFLRTGERTSYRWRTIPPPRFAPDVMGRKDGGSRLVLMLQLALHWDSGGRKVSADAGFGGGHGAWTKPFSADQAGTYLRLLRGDERSARAQPPGTGQGQNGAVMLHLWIKVTKEGLETRIVFRGEWVFTNHLPQDIQVAWVTATGVGNADRRLVEPAGTRGGLNLVACGPPVQEADGGLGENVGPGRPPSCSALTASSAPSAPSALASASASGVGQGQRKGGGRLSELMLEFRLATSDAVAFVGSVGPPPIATGNPVAHTMAREGSNGGSFVDRGRGGRNRKAELGLHDVDGEAADSNVGAWGVTRQSEWVEARPSVHLALISCSSTDPGVPGFAFWCVASRQVSHLDDCAACVSRADGHHEHVGQMMIDLHPVALVWNRCSQAMRAVLNDRSGGGRWPADQAAADLPPDLSVELQETADESGGGEHGGAGWRRCPRSTYTLSRSTAAIQPGGCTAVCRQPFADYDLALASAMATTTALGSSDEDRPATLPFLVSVPSEILSRRCKSAWLPLHSRALTDDVLCPLVVVASRLLDADWPSLSLSVYAGLSVQNHLSVPLSLRAGFTRPLFDDNWVPSVQPEEGQEEESGAPTRGREVRVWVEQDESAEQPLLRQEICGGSEASLADSSNEAGGGSSGSVAGFTRVFSVSAESCHSAWEMFQDGASPIPFLLPDVALDIGLDSTSMACSDSTAAEAGQSPPVLASERTAEEVSTSLAPQDFATNRSCRLKVSLGDDVNELVLIPWEAVAQGAVLPAVLTLERDSVVGGVELIRLVVHPRVVVHNATGLRVSMSLLSAAQAGDSHKPEGKAGCVGGLLSEAPPRLPRCRVRLTPEGSGSRMDLLAMPGERVVPSHNGSHHGPRRPPAAASAAGRGVTPEPGTPSNSDAPTGLLGKLSRMLPRGTYKAASQRPAGFSADIEVAFGWDDDDAEQAPGGGGGIGAGAEIEGFRGVRVPTDEGAARTGSTRPSPRTGSGGVDELAVFSLHEPSFGSPLVSRPSSLTVRTDRDRRAVRVCVAAESSTPSPGAEPTSKSPTRHVLLYRDPQPDLTICNRSTGPVTLVFDCGTFVEVGLGCTAEHSWQHEPAPRDRSGKNGAGGARSDTLSRRRTPSSSTVIRMTRNWSEDSRGASGGERKQSPTRKAPTPPSPAPQSPAISTSGAGAPPPDGRRSCVSSPAQRKVRPHGRLGGDATLQHWFQCRGGGRGDPFSSWSEPVWVARGVQVMRFDSHIGGGGEEGWGYRENAQGDAGGQAGFDTVPARAVQVHIVERAGGFVMSFAEGGFEGSSVDGIDVIRRGPGGSAVENRAILHRWAATLEQHVVVSVSGFTLQLLDDSDLQSVVAAAGKKKTSAAARVVAPERPGEIGGWIGGTWEEPGGLLSDGAAAHPPAASIPAIISVFVDASSMRLWRTAPLVRPGMSSLDLERSWHLRDRVGVDICLGTLQIDNHLAGHRLPVLFCFREGGCLVHANGTYRGGDREARKDCRFTMSMVLAEVWEHSRVPSYLEKITLRSAPIDVCFEDSLLPPLIVLLERAGVGGGFGYGSPPPSPIPVAAVANRGDVSPEGAKPRLLPPALGASMVPRLFIQRVDIGALVVRATVQGYIPGKQVFLALDKSPLLFRPVSLRGVLARPDEIAEQIASNYAVDALLRSLAVVGSLEALGSPTTLLSEWGKGVYDLFAMPIKAMPQGPSSTVRASFRGVSSLLRHASAGTLSSVSGVTNALSRNLGSRGAVARPIAGTMGLVHRTSRSLIASTGVDSEWTHAKAATAASPATAYLNADLWYRCCLLPAGHEFLYRTPALCSNASYSQANVPVTIVLSSKAVFLYRGGSGCETLWKQIEHQDITLIEQSAEHAPAELILNARGYRRPRSSTSPLGPSARSRFSVYSASPPRVRAPSTAAASAGAAVIAATDSAGVPGSTGASAAVAAAAAAAATLEVEEVTVGGLLMKLSLPSSTCCRELAQLLLGLSDKA